MHRITGRNRYQLVISYNVDFSVYEIYKIINKIYANTCISNKLVNHFPVLQVFIVKIVLHRQSNLCFYMYLKYKITPVVTVFFFCSDLGVVGEKNPNIQSFTEKFSVVRPICLSCPQERPPSVRNAKIMKKKTFSRLICELGVNYFPVLLLKTFIILSITCNFIGFFK